ncbi:hypothetical protein C0033_25030 [Clostridium sp. chh4-2]|uniref:UxaA family hydrolase n=1 Tax=Clostridium sp. chh4-2 TaxID=2067550 RepID=UPI000CCF4A5D|nr:UxaA family hydrolase [Clostridium sp. chh4-2]PNV59241.1 hypothetical protein C0033_25030 [Clostridium sp. chh4-2]
MINGYRRNSKAAGIRNKLLVLYTVNCSAFIAQSIGRKLRQAGLDVDVAGNESCYDNQSMVDQLLRLSIHPNVGAVLVVGHGCEFIQADKIAEFAKHHGREAEMIYGQQLGTREGIENGVKLGYELAGKLKKVQKEVVSLNGMAIGLSISACDETVFSCLPLLEAVLTSLMSQGAAILLADHYLCGLHLDEAEKNSPDAAELKMKVERCFTPHLSGFFKEKKTAVEAYLMKYLAGCVKLAQIPQGPGIWFSDALQDYGVMKGPLNGGVAGELMQYAGNGAVLNLMLTGRGTPVSSVVTPTLIMTGNRNTKERMREDVDWFIDPSQETTAQILDLIARTMSGALTCPEKNGQDHALLFQNAQNRRSCDGCMEK